MTALCAIRPFMGPVWKGSNGSNARVRNLLPERSVMCRFLDAGITRGASCSGVRRPKSASARSLGKFGRRAGGRRYGDLIVAPVMMVRAKVARGDLDRVGSG